MNICRILDLAAVIETYADVTFAGETLLTGEEVLIAAAAAEAVALARLAVEVAKDAAQMSGSNPTMKSEKAEDFLSNSDILRLESVWLSNIEHVTPRDNSLTFEEDPNEDTQYSSGDTVDSTVTCHKGITARSGHQSERRARRARSAEKATTASVIPIKFGSSSRKKCSFLQEIDYSDPLCYLRRTTSTSRLLMASEELELSGGIQDLLKLERLQRELAVRNCGKPTFAQWASAAEVDQKMLRSRLNYGIHCKDKMIKSNIRSCSGSSICLCFCLVVTTREPKIILHSKSLEAGPLCVSKQGSCKP